jgi:hypothetical protein
MAKRNAQRPVVVAVVSDLHAGSTVALCPHEIALDDGGAYQASRAQRWLWDLWLRYWDEVSHKRDALGADLYVVVNGDITDGDHHGTTQILSGNPTAQAAVVNAQLAVPLALRPDRLWFVRGTEAHVGKSAAFEERVALGLKKDGRPVVMSADTGTASHWHARLDIHGVRFDFAHHGRVGQRPWTKPNVTMNMAAEIFYEHAKHGLPHPHLAIRSHMHQFVDTYHAHPVRAIQTPAWQLPTAFIHRIAPGALADIGGLIITVQPGESDPATRYHVDPVIYRPDPPTLWRHDRS